MTQPESPTPTQARGAVAWNPDENRSTRRITLELEIASDSPLSDEDVLDDLQSWRIADSNALELGPKTTSSRDRLLRHGDVGVAILLAQSLAPDVAQAPKYRELQPARRASAPARRGYVP